MHTNENVPTYRLRDGEWECIILRELCCGDRFRSYNSCEHWIDDPTVNVNFDELPILLCLGEPYIDRASGKYTVFATNELGKLN